MDAFRFLKSAREYLTPVLTESAFHDRGMLTPDEFITAGDNLVRTCPTWRWESGDKGKERSYLPNNKQYLMTSSVPCYRRLNVLQNSKLIEENVASELGGESGNDWCKPALEYNPNSDLDDELLVDAMDGINENDGKDTKASSNIIEPIVQITHETVINNKLDDNEYLDMEDESLALDDATTNKNAPLSPQSIFNFEKGNFENEKSNNISSAENHLVRSRRYDVSITYDNYYRTPRIWLFGFDENGSPLTPTQLFEDIMQDYAQKTVTIDPHPHTGKPHASIHPCQHGPAMLKIIESLKECENIPTVDQYLFIFLKFIQSVVPTIEYDYTIDVQVR
eukprot:gene14908-20053_t